MIKDNSIILIEDLTKVVETHIRRWSNNHVEVTNIRVRKWRGKHSEATKEKMRLAWVKRKERNDTDNRI